MLVQFRITPTSPLTDEPKTRAYPARQFRQALAFALLGVTLLGSVVLSAQAAGTALHGLAQGAGSTQAESYYLASLRVYPSSPATHFGYGIWLSTQHRDGEALAHFNYAVANGFNSSICYAYLAHAAEVSGDLASAERSLATAVSVYPRSVFLLVSYSSVLTRAGHPDTSQSVFARAISLDARAARGWQLLIDHDIDAAFAAARQDKNIAMPGELTPQTAVFEVLRENERRFPEATSTGWRARMQSLKTQ
jgi:predicted Zn-dependent protease